MTEFANIELPLIVSSLTNQHQPRQAIKLQPPQLGHARVCECGLTHTRVDIPHTQFTTIIATK